MESSRCNGLEETVGELSLFIDKLVSIEDDSTYSWPACLECEIRNGSTEVFAGFAGGSISLQLISDVLHKDNQISVRVSSSLRSRRRRKIYTRIGSSDSPNLTHFQPLLEKYLRNHHRSQHEIQIGSGSG